MPQPKHNISAERVIDLVISGQHINDCYIDGKITLEGFEAFEKPIIFKNCVIDFFSGSSTIFKDKVSFSNCHFKNCSFIFTYFESGLSIEGCVFDKYLDFQAGGHNKTGAVALTSNEFKGFVNFFDCWYESDVNISTNIFHEGTNLLGSPHNIPVTFDKTPVIEGNSGKINYNDERNSTL